MDRYSRNKATISEREQGTLASSTVTVVGCGGLGGYALEMLARIGIGYIRGIDGDVFEESNLNRQLLSSPELLGTSKVLAAEKRIAKINPLISFSGINEYIREDNVRKHIAKSHIVVDALDSIESRLLLEGACEDLQIPLIYGAIAGFYGQVSTIFPGDKTIEKLYQKKQGRGIEKDSGNPSFTPALVASIQVSEAVKILLGKGEPLRKKILFIDALYNEYETISLA